MKLDLTEYEIEVPPELIREVSEEPPKQMYPIKKNLASLLRAMGVFRTGEEIAEAVTLAKRIRDTEDNFVEIDEQELTVLKVCLNRHIEITAEGKNNFGGPLHEELITRVFSLGA